MLLSEHLAEFFGRTSAHLYRSVSLWHMFLIQNQIVNQVNIFFSVISCFRSPPLYMRLYTTLSAA